MSTVDLKAEMEATRKEILLKKIDANFMSYSGGTMYYTIQLEKGLYQFPISVVEDAYEENHKNGIKLSSDLGTATFEAVMKGSLLCRWINKAIENFDFIKIG